MPLCCNHGAMGFDNISPRDPSCIRERENLLAANSVGSMPGSSSSPGRGSLGSKFASPCRMLIASVWKESAYRTDMHLRNHDAITQSEAVSTVPGDQHLNGRCLELPQAAAREVLLPSQSASVSGTRCPTDFVSPLWPRLHEGRSTKIRRPDQSLRLTLTTAMPRCLRPAHVVVVLLSLGYVSVDSYRSPAEDPQGTPSNLRPARRAHRRFSCVHVAA